MLSFFHVKGMFKELPFYRKDKVSVNEEQKGLTAIIRSRPNSFSNIPLSCSTYVAFYSGFVWFNCALERQPIYCTTTNAWPRFGRQQEVCSIQRRQCYASNSLILPTVLNGFGAWSDTYRYITIYCWLRLRCVAKFA